MLHAGLDLSRRRLDVCPVDDAGGLVAQLVAAPARLPLLGQGEVLAQRLARPLAVGSDEKHRARESVSRRPRRYRNACEIRQRSGSRTRSASRHQHLPV